MAARRLAALVALVLALASVVVAAVTVVTHFPRGLYVLVLLFVALAAGWHGLLHRGPIRVIGLAIALVAAAGAVVLLVSRDAVAVIAVVVTAAAAIGSARAAFAFRVKLPGAPRPERPALIFNPRSGGGKATRFNLSEEAHKRGIKAIELAPGKDLNDLIAGALADGADALAMAGGDGTQALGAAAAARAGIPFACIPAGTRNHFALDLGVDRNDVVGALDAFVNGGERIVDLAEVNDRVFVNNVSLGLYADAVQHTGYRDAKLRTLLDTIPEEVGAGALDRPLRWRDPDGVQHDGGIAVLVSNNPYRLGRAVGSGTRPRLDTGELGVAVMGPSQGFSDGLLRLWSLPAIEVDSEDSVPAGIDGEAVMLDPPLRFTMRPGALRVRIAPQHPGCSPSALLPDGTWGATRALLRIAIAGSVDATG